MSEALNILIVATKAPWPPVDGGKVVVWETLGALAGAGHRVTLVAPHDPTTDAEDLRAALAPRCRPELVATSPRGLPASVLGSIVGREPLTVSRHRSPALSHHVERLLASEHFDVVQAEQLQAVAQTDPATARGVPLVHRAHNVESALWSFTATFHGSLQAALFRREAARLAAWEGRIVRRASATVVLTALDLEPIRRLAGAEADVERVAAPFPAALPAGGFELPGRPAVVTLASRTWAPSRETIRQVANSWWPEVRRRLPDAVLHVFSGVSDGASRSGVRWHPAPPDSARAFPDGAITAIPTRHPTGVPVKALESWARGLPVVASPGTAGALEAEDERELLIADGPERFADAIELICESDELRRQLVEGGRRALQGRHDPGRVAERLSAVYRRVMNPERP
jgi:hypothetical protein